MSGGLRYEVQEGKNAATTVAANSVLPDILPALSLKSTPQSICHNLFGFI